MKKHEIFSQSLIETLAKPLDEIYADNVLGNTSEIINTCITNMCKNKPIVTKYDIKMVNECSTFSEIQNSSMDLFVILESPQLELSTINLNKNTVKKFFNRFVVAWQSSRNEKKFKKIQKKRLKQKKANKDQNDDLPKQIYLDPNFNQTKYTLTHFKNDFMIELSKYFTEKTTLLVNNKGIKIVCNEDLGMNVNLYLVFKDNNAYKLFDTTTNNFTIVDFKNREDKIYEKNKETNENFRNILRIFNGLYYNVMNNPLNQIFIESLLYYTPNELFESDENIYNIFIKILNFINLKKPVNFKSIIDENKLLVDEELCKNSITDFVKFLILVTKNI